MNDMTSHITDNAIDCVTVCSTACLVDKKHRCPASLAICEKHYSDVLMDTMASQITSLTIVYSTVYSGIDQRKHQRSTSMAFVRGTHRWSANSPHKWSVTRKMFPFDYVIMEYSSVMWSGMGKSFFHATELSCYVLPYGRNRTQWVNQISGDQMLPKMNTRKTKHDIYANW